MSEVAPHDEIPITSTKPGIINLPQTSNAQTSERAYHHHENFFIKRSLRPEEYLINNRGETIIPRLGKERLQNEAAALHYIRNTTDIPVPSLYGAFEIDNSFMVIMEHINGIQMAKLSDEQKVIVTKEVEQHLATLRRLKSDTIGGPSGLVIPPYRVMNLSNNDSWARNRTTSSEAEYVFCHGDLSQHNILVDPQTLRIQAIIDWEYAGFFPGYFEGLFYKRPGPSVALEEEYDDSVELLRFMKSV
ncbi:uncharacterized protein N7503_005806 [Penicillium pulvis]|uniref:uncharacterized protein n=1 Tax=Penicillium pulvis TaxID=1562058 RepID=UPI0025499AFE|nr:uncharacterized protein N7503_005806 [Penicillium pulvis]KAJ5803356.1 hypothetical protein N7503_005806 [Penicillium pulvis]